MKFPLHLFQARWFIRTLSLVVGFVLGTAAPARAQLLFEDTFTYPDGKIVGAPGSPWVNNYAPANEASVVSRALYLTHTNQESIRCDFPAASNTGFLYVRMTVNFSELPQGGGNYFAFFRGNFVDNLRCRIWATTNAAAAGKFRLGITTISSPPAIIPQDLFLGTNYNIVARYELANSRSTLWLNPADEASTANSAADLVDNGAWTIGQFGFLQTAFYQAGAGNYIGALTVDDLRIGRTFEEVMQTVKFTSITNAADGTMGFKASGQATTNYTFQASTNLASGNWVSLSTNAAGANGLFNLSDTSATNHPSRFYRLIRQ